jgi:uncharacterized protein (DUF427 family)
MEVSSVRVIARKESGEPHVLVEPCPRRVRVRFGGEWIADTRRALLLHEVGHVPTYYLPLDDVRMDLLEPTEHHTTCPWKGEASYWTLRAGDRVAENAVWSYPHPLDEQALLAGYVAFYWNRVDQWFEEDEEVYVHPRDPYKRVDVLRSSRHVRVEIGGVTVAETHRPWLLFETGLPTRTYFSPEDVRLDLLEPTATRSECPYKGVARYWSVRAGHELREDVAWSYPFPTPECPKIAGLICFYDERVDAVIADGERVEPPQTRWSPRA